MSKEPNVIQRAHDELIRTWTTVRAEAMEIERQERVCIEAALRLCGGYVKRAAALLDLPESSLRRYMDRYAELKSLASRKRGRPPATTQKVAEWGNSPRRRK